MNKIKQIKDTCDKARSDGGGQVAFNGGVASFDSSGGLIAASLDLGRGMGFASAQLAGRDALERASVDFSFSRPYRVGSAKIDSAQFTGSVPIGGLQSLPADMGGPGPFPPGMELVGVFTAASGTVWGIGGSIAESLILDSLNDSPEARGAATQIGLLLGTPCEGILALLAAAGKY
jgi:hypothetical protein